MSDKRYIRFGQAVFDIEKIAAVSVFEKSRHVSDGPEIHLEATVVVDSVKFVLQQKAAVEFIEWWNRGCDYHAMLEYSKIDSDEIGELR